jgi:hypothetical protein
VGKDIQRLPRDVVDAVPALQFGKCAQYTSVQGIC